MATADTKPESPTDLTKPSVRFVLRKTAREFTADECTDLAAALTYYAVLSLFPALLVMVSLLGVVGQGKRTTDAVLSLIDDVAPGSAMETLRPTVEQLVGSHAAGFTLILGLLGALWSASNYVAAFGRAMNRMYGIGEGRPFFKLRSVQLLITFGGLVLAAAAAFMLAISGPVTRSVGDAIGAGHLAVTLWSVLRWPVILVFMIVAVAVLYYATPNIKTPKFRWLSPGAALGIIVWIAVSLLFGLYVANFGSYNKTYGTLAGVIVFLLWLWITNLALLFGAELDAELERGRELQAGMAAEEQLQLPARDTRGLEKDDATRRRFVDEARALRRRHGHAR